MNIACPHCHGLMVGDGIAPGSTILCPHCRNQFLMSSAPAEAAPGSAPMQPGPGPGPAATGGPAGAGPGPMPAGPRPGPAPTGPRPGAAPAGGGSVPQPVVQAAWSEVGRRHTPFQASNFMLGAGLVFVLVGVVVVIFVVVLNARPGGRDLDMPKTAGSKNVDLKAKISCSPTEIKITNVDAFAWTDVRVGINTSGGKGGYWARVKKEKEKYTEPTRYLALPFSRFENSAGETFDPSVTDVKHVIVKAATSAGPGECRARLK